MNSLAFRLRLAIWAFRNPDRLTMLHFEMLQRKRDLAQGFIAERALSYLTGMPGARENAAALADIDRTVRARITRKAAL